LADRHLGGEELYGDDPTVPLRELIQNGADAIRARRLADDKDSDWGAICVKQETVDGKDVITVVDNGVGMSREVLCGPFIDFGTSYWGSALMVKEHPGLMRKGFAST
jgi:nitrogen fixation/metabolism regulation signal transduction histidine kinase